MTRSYCPKCGSDRTITKDVQQQDGNIRRRRECNACGWRYTTMEVPLDEFNRLRYHERDYKELLQRIVKAADSMNKQIERQGRKHK